MNRIILLILILLINATWVFCETIPPKGVPMTRETHPIYFSYIDDYFTRLKDALESSRFYRHRGWGASYSYLITKDGEIKNMKGTTFQNNYFDRKIKEVILSVKPEPFRDGMESEDIMFDTFMGFYKYEEFDISVGFQLGDVNRKVIDLDISTKKR